MRILLSSHNFNFYQIWNILAIYLLIFQRYSKSDLLFTGSSTASFHQYLHNTHHLHKKATTYPTNIHQIIITHFYTFIQRSGILASYIASRDSFKAALITIVPSIANFKSRKQEKTVLMTRCIRSISCLRNKLKLLITKNLIVSL